MARKIEERVSTKQKPYHYLGAGLANVFLVGVRYVLDRDTGDESVGVPRLPELLDAVAKALVEKRSPLVSAEVRFLRKRLGIASKDFAVMVGLSPEQYSRVENEAAAITPMLDRMIRLMYAAVAKLQPEIAEGVAIATWQAEVTHGERIIATQDAEQRWVVKTRAA